MNYTFYSGFSGMLSDQGAEKTADYAKELGFSSVELYEDAGPESPKLVRDLRQAEKVRAVLTSRGLSVACYSVGACVYQNDDAVESLLRNVEIAAALGSPCLHHTMLPWLTMPANAPGVEAGLAIAAEAAVRVARHAESLGLTCIYEDQGLFVNGVRNFSLFYQMVKNRCPNVGICGDFGNILFVDEDPANFLRTFAADIKHVHVKDYHRRRGAKPGEVWMPTKGGYWLKDAVVGEGVIDIAACMKVLKEAGYRGAYALELCHAEPFEDGVRAAMNLLDSLA